MAVSKWNSIYHKKLYAVRADIVKGICSFIGYDRLYIRVIIAICKHSLENEK